jgi:predicted neuraminidase
VVGGQPLAVENVPYMAEGMVQYRAGNAWSDRNHRYCVGVMVSDDEGQSFRRCGYLKGGVHGWLIEPRVVELERGHVVMLIRSQRDGRLWRAESFDDGETWSDPVRSEIPNPGAKVLVLKARDGRIFLIHNPIDPTVDKGRGRNPLSLWVSHDGMKTWYVKTDLVRDPNLGQPLNYPDGYIDEEAGQLVFLWEDAHSVFFCRLPLDVQE